MRIALALAFLAGSTGVAAAQPRDFCASRPGLNTPPCTVEPGRAVVELGLVDWTRDDQPDARTDNFELGNALVRIGLDTVTEAQIGWTAYGVMRTRDRTTGQIERARGTGDVQLGLRRSLSGPNGPIAVQPFVTLPTGGRAIGSGDWSAGVVVPIAFDLGKGVSLAISPELNAAVDKDRSGRHLAYGSALGLSVDVTASLSASIELQAKRDHDPDGSKTTAFASTSFALMVGADTQIDLGTVIGLTHASADAQLYAGISRRF